MPISKSCYAAINGRKNIDNNFEITVDFENETSKNSIQIAKSYKTILKEHIYWFGYKYNGEITDSNLYKAFLKFVENVKSDDQVEYRCNAEGINVPYSPDCITESELDSLIIRSFENIGINRFNIDIIVYPRQCKNNLVWNAIASIKRYLKDSDRITYDQLKKLAEDRTEVSKNQHEKAFANDMEAFRNMDPEQFKKYIIEKYERESREVLRKAHKVLIVDDFEETNNINDIISLVSKKNESEDLDIYIFTMFGNFIVQN